MDLVNQFFLGERPRSPYFSSVSLVIVIIRKFGGMDTETLHFSMVRGNGLLQRKDLIEDL